MKNNESIMDWKEVKLRLYGNGQIQKMPTQNRHKNQTTIVWAYKQRFEILKAEENNTQNTQTV